MFSEAVLPYWIICGTILLVIVFIGLTIAFFAFRETSGISTLEKGRRSLEYDRLQRESKLKLNGRVADGD